MDKEELNNWRMCDVNVPGASQAIIIFAYQGKWKATKKVYKRLRSKYDKIDVENLDSRFPVDVIIQTRSKIYEMGDALVKNNYDELVGIAEELGKLSLEFRKPPYGKGYDEYRSHVNESERPKT
jgi:hypothetical protein